MSSFGSRTQKIATFVDATSQTQQVAIQFLQVCLIYFIKKLQKHNNPGASH